VNASPRPAFNAARAAAQFPALRACWQAGIWLHTIARQSSARAGATKPELKTASAAAAIINFIMFS
jgi:hypothetical protein